MNRVESFFTPFIGQVVWQVRRGHGSFLTMEFGAPHLVAREPIDASPERAAVVRRNLRRRHVVVTGDWHFWVEYGGWKISTTDGVLTGDDPAGSQTDECLKDLEGQKLASVCVNTGERSCKFVFDLDACLEIWSSAEIHDDQWSLYGWNGDIVTLRHDGVLVVEKANLDRRRYKPLYPTLRIE